MPKHSPSVVSGLRADSGGRGRKRLSRAEKKAQTRDQVLKAATRVFARRGFHGASVEDVAAEAGFSKGAVYSNFESKEDLFLELDARQVEMQMLNLKAVLDAECSEQERVRRSTRWFVDFVAAERDYVMLFFEVWAAAVRDPRLRAKFVARRQHMRQALAKLLEEQARSLGLALAAPAEHVAIAALAIGNGFVVQKLADPDGVPDEVFELMLASLLGSALSPEAQ